MRAGSVLIALIAASWMPTSEGILLITGLTAATAGTIALALGGLAALKVAAIVGYAAGRRFKRSTDPDIVAEEEMLLSTAGQLDPSGCVLKLLCKLQTKVETERTFEEEILVSMFSNGTDALTPYNAPFVYAADIGQSVRDSAVCDRYFAKCPLGDTQLRGLLKQAWGCGFEGGVNNGEH